MPQGHQFSRQALLFDRSPCFCSIKNLQSFFFFWKNRVLIYPNRGLNLIPCCPPRLCGSLCATLLWFFWESPSTIHDPGIFALTFSHFSGSLEQHSRLWLDLILLLHMAGPWTWQCSVTRAMRGSMRFWVPTSSSLPFSFYQVAPPNQLFLSLQGYVPNMQQRDKNRFQTWVQQLDWGKEPMMNINLKMDSRNDYETLSVVGTITTP